MHLAILSAIYMACVSLDRESLLLGLIQLIYILSFVYVIYIPSSRESYHLASSR